MSFKTILYVVICSFVLIFLPDFQEKLVYDFQQVMDYELWRLVTGHLVHISGRHLFFDASVLLICGCFLNEKVNGLELLGLIVFCCLIISLTLFFFYPEMQRYAGLSGVGYMLITIVLLGQVRGYISKIILTLFLTFWVLFSVSQNISFVQTSDYKFILAWQSHLIGVCAGVIYNFAVTKRKKDSIR